MDDNDVSKESPCIHPYFLPGRVGDDENYCDTEQKDELWNNLLLLRTHVSMMSWNNLLLLRTHVSMMSRNNLLLLRTCQHDEQPPSPVNMVSLNYKKSQINVFLSVDNCIK